MASLHKIVSSIPGMPSVAGRAAGTVDDIVGGLWWTVRSGVTRIPPFRIPSVATAVVRSGTPTIGTAFAFHAAANPGRLAILDSRGSVTWGELDERVNRLANALLALGAERGVRLAYMLPNCREAVEAAAAAGKLGLAPVPVNTRFQAEEVEHLLRSQRVGCVVVDPDLEDRCAGYDGPVLVRGSDYEQHLAAASPNPPAEPPGAMASEGSRVVIHTSGTTGHPKGAERELTHTDPVSIIGFLSRVPIATGDVVYIPAPLFHALGIAGVTLALGLGATMVFRDRFDAAEVLALMEEQDVTGAVVVPVMLRRMLEAMAPGALDVDVSGLRWILCSGSALPPALEARAREMLGPVIRNLYGSTEAGWVSIATPEDAAAHPGTVGRPLPGVRVEIRDEAGDVLPDGEVGEIVVRSKTVFEGYTAESGPAARSGADPLVYHLGDMGWVEPTGHLFVADRADDMVVTGGENVYPAEVERVLAEAPGVGDCTVVGAVDEEYGKVLVGFVVPKHAETIDVDAVTRYVRSRIANYKVPKHVWVVDELPYNATGKVLRRHLREDAARRLSGDPGGS